MSDWASVRVFGGVGAGDAVLFLMMTLQVIVAPYTKVEESFNTQALHDLSHHGTNISAYDHLEFPGVVPRSFLGPLTVLAFLFPISALQNLMYHAEDKFSGQVKARLALGILVLLALRRYKQAVSGVYGHVVGTWLMLITASQFHFTFYMSRPLPNTFALIIVLVCMQKWLQRSHAHFIWLSALVCIVVRTELVLLLGPMLLVEVYQRRLSVRTVLLHALPAGLLCLALTVLVDSWFWRRWLWPEGEVFYFNAVLNKSGQYGTSPYLWYVYSVLPRCLLSSTLLVPAALRLDVRTRMLTLPALVFILLFSILPHKELRFVIYVVPVLNTLAAVTCARWWQNRSKSWARTLLALIAAGHLLVNALLCGGFMYISHHNYPGGQAIKRLHELEPASSPVNVHLDVFVCQTGVSRYTQLHDNWVYNKTEGLSPGGADLMTFTHLILGVTPPNRTETRPYKRTHKTLATINAFHKLQFNGLNGLLKFNPVEVVIEPKAVILKKVFDDES